MCDVVNHLADVQLLIWTVGSPLHCGRDVDDSLPPKAPADLHGNGAHHGYGHIEEAGRLIAHIEVPLAARPDSQGTIIVPQGRARMGLNIALVDWTGKRFVFDDHVSNYFLSIIIDRRYGETGMQYTAG